MRNFLFLFFFTFTCVVQAQYTSRLGTFKVDQIRGCAPLTVNITPIAACNPCTIVSDGTGCLATTNPPCSNVFTLNYSAAGTYTLNLVHQGGGSDDITVTVDPNVAPNFEIYSCAGSKVEVNITDKTYDKYYIDFNYSGAFTVDATIPSGNTQTVTHPYGAVGNYTIGVKGQKNSAANNCNINSQAFKALNSLPAPGIVSLKAKDASSLRLDFTPQNNIQYHSEVAYDNSINFQLNQILYGTDSMIAKSLSVDNNYYCYRLGAYDPCSGASTYALPICSQKFSLNLLSGDDQLAWQTSSAGITGISIQRDNALLKNVAATTAQYDDKAITCKTNYCYQLISNYSNNAKSYSLQKCGTAFLTQTPTAINNISSIVGSSQVDLSWITNPAYTIPSFDIFREPIGGSFSLLGNSTTKQYSDPTYTENGLCYQINYKDNCDNVSSSGLPACPIRLSGSTDPLNEINLKWSAYKGWNQGVKNYTLQRYYTPGGATQVIYNGPDSTYFDNQTDHTNQVVYYKVIAQAIEAGVSVSSSNEIKVERSVNLYSPTAFNPESKSSLNRTFGVRGFYIAKMELQIFDRWGSLVFYTDSNETWNGKRDGQDMPDATYVWTAEVTDLAGNNFRKAGTVVLIRK
ncbi:MAG: gliding motility-associated C-terminal domain-containing protein [Cyclobacteriaceae bacterium]